MHATTQENFEKMYKFGVSWCIFLTDFVLKFIFKVIYLYRIKMIYVDGRFRAFSNNINYKLYNFCIFCNIYLCLEDIAGNLKNCLARYTLLVYDLEFTPIISHASQDRMVLTLRI